MACKCFKQELLTVPLEMSGPQMPDRTVVSVCQLGRDQRARLNWQECKARPHNGPCWVWDEEHPGERDAEFEQYKG